MEVNKIYNENCIDTMARMGDKQVNLVITSPPYNMNLRIRNGKYCSRQIVKEFSTKYSGFNDNMPIDDFFKTHKQILSELIRVSKIVFYNFQVVTGSKRAFFKLIGEFSDEIKDVIIWDKVNAQPAMQSDVMNSQNEIILILGDNPISRKFTNSNFKRGEINNVWRIKRGKKISKEHGAVFPEELVNKILKNFTKKNDLVYDPFMGTGTTAKIAKLNKCNYVGSEINENYCKIAEQRLLWHIK
jgi:site-specific DNA-methyltransferase (adenine-specific)/modification methylase